MSNRHTMHLDAAPFEAIVARRKTVELRVNDAKRQAVKVGDTIEFTLRTDKTKTLLVRVTDVQRAADFETLVKQTPAAKLGCNDGMAVATLLLRLNRAYNEAERKEFGVVGLGFSLLSAN